MIILNFMLDNDWLRYEEMKMMKRGNENKQGLQGNEKWREKRDQSDMTHTGWMRWETGHGDMMG